MERPIKSAAPKGLRPVRLDTTEYVDTAITTTRFRNLTLEGIKDEFGEVWTVLVRPSSLHGAAVQLRLHEEKWRAQGYVDFQLQIGGEELTAAQRALCPPELTEILT